MGRVVRILNSGDGNPTKSTVRYEDVRLELGVGGSRVVK